MYIISSCLLGKKCRYNGTDCSNDQVEKFIHKNQVIEACPELLGGLSTPRNPAEIVGGSGNDVINGTAKVVDNNGNDVTTHFIKGAYETLKLAKEHGVNKVILKENSPSCGCHFIYDGSFSSKKKKGLGVTAALLSMNGIEVVSENTLKET
ncbi:DUF523 domain-containing protein [Bacillus carboniphilus]|uniref:DUF523 domain-containing protein n=1 Tax=Bacillus carboniphilus TaxID=86663 RepID=A0ABY9JRW7_9BACI|nr:DUF523 domain-containing protein [Bacillus carboniphilus]WLR42131.1 DUF523 domain-containing protein [Bacillus carboniphilus]